jgi:hypothetical protein
MALEEALAELTAADRDVLLQSLPALEKLSEILLGAREEI